MTDRTGPDPALKAIAVTTGTGESRNVMSYMADYDPPPGHNPPQYMERYVFSDSQIQIMRKFLRYETAIPVGYDCEFTHDCIGGRARLGDYVQRRPADALDFDGDNKRDIAWWTPPSAFSGSGEWVVLLSGASPPYNPDQKVTVTGFGDIGDIPVPADYNGDGLADIAVYQPGGDPFGGNPNRSYWKVCNHYDCSGVVPRYFGLREDVPLPALDFDGDPATTEIATYRPSVGRWTWEQWYPTLGANYTTRDTGGGNAIPLPGLYDTDAMADLVVYLPDYKTFALLFSSDSWTVPTFQVYFPNDCVANDYDGATSFTRSSCVPVRGMTRHVFTHYGPAPWHLPVYEPRLVLSVWRPQDGEWATVWSPTVVSEPVYAQLGSVNEIPLGGIGSPWSTLISQSYSRYTTLLASAWSAPGTLSFRTAPSGSSWTRSTPSIGPKTMVFSVRDMTGDKLPEIFLVDPGTMQAVVLASENDYTTSASFSPIQLGMAGLNQWSLIL